MISPKLHIVPLALALGALAASAADPQVGTGTAAGMGRQEPYILVWQDLFDGNELNPIRWNIEVNGSGGGNHELQYYTDRPENVRVGDDGQGNGCLILTARREDYKGRAFTSGRINSKNLIAFTHGKVEAAIKLPATANGLWPAFWMMGNDYDEVGWPKCGETDIMEFGNAGGIAAGTQDRYFNGACHWGQAWPQNSKATSTTRGYSLQDGEFHIYTCIWDEGEVRMYVDLDKNDMQNPYFRMTFPCTEPDNEKSPGNYFHKLNFILFNLAVGGDFTGIHESGKITALNDDNGQQASVYVNYVKIYQKGGVGEDTFFADAGDPQPEDGVEVNVAEDAALQLEGETLTASKSDTPIQVFDLAGRLHTSATAGRLHIGSLPAGVYIARSGACAIKLIKH